LVVSALFSSANLLLSSSADSTTSSQKSGPSLLSNLTGTGLTSVRTAPDTYTPSLLSSLDGSGFDASFQAPYAQKTTAADALATAVANTQKDADAAAQTAQQNPDLSQAAFSQLSQDMANLSALMQKNSQSQSASGTALGDGTSADSIVITAGSGSGSIAAMASDSANSSGSEEISSVAYVGADGQAWSSGQGSITASDGTTYAANLGYSVSAGSDASSSQSAAVSAYASVGTQQDPARAMQWVGVLLNTASGNSTDAAQNAQSATDTTAIGNADLGSGSGSYASASTFMASIYQPGYSSGNWISGQSASVSVYA
jgi:hypothetical protein